MAGTYDSYCKDIGTYLVGHDNHGNPIYDRWYQFTNHVQWLVQ